MTKHKHSLILKNSYSFKCGDGCGISSLMQLKFIRFLHFIEYTERIFYDHVRLFHVLLGTILQNIFPWESFMFKIQLMKFVLLKYLDGKIIFTKIKLIFAFQNWTRNLKMSDFLTVLNLIWSIKKSFLEAYLSLKIYWISHTTLRNSMIAIILTVQLPIRLAI